MEFFNVISVEEAKKNIMDTFDNYKPKITEVDLIKSSGRILAQDIFSEVNIPEFNRSTVDGYAIKSSDSHGASETIPSFLNVEGSINMGEEVKDSISYGEAMYVPTGGMLPIGADAVVMIENTESLDDETVLIHKPVFVNENVILKGDDIKEGTKVLTKGRKLKGQDIGAIASLGIAKVKVYEKLKFSVISTGDEIIDLNEESSIGKIRDINGYALSSMIEELGGEVVNKVLVKDDYNLLKSEVESSLETSDIILISGGSSVGTRDYTYDVINSFQGKGVFIHGISIKPGKPTIVGEAKGKAVFGLPGHPVSSIVVYKALVEYFVNKLYGYKKENNKIRVIVDFNIHSHPGRDTYQMVTIEERNNKIHAIPNHGKSGMISLLTKSHGYIIIKSHEEGVNIGEERDVYFL